MTSRTGDQQHILTLRERSKGFLQVLLPHFTLTKQGRGLLLEVAVTDDLPSIVDSAGKKQFSQRMALQSGDARRRVTRLLFRFYRDSRLLAYHFECPNFPFRYANGGVLPIVRLDSHEYFSLLYRDIFPIGWNIANGGSDCLEEMLDPHRTLVREFGEELFICDHEKKLIYAFDPGDENAPPGFQSEALEAWKRRFSDRDLGQYKRLSIPLKWIEGPDSVRAAVLKKKHTSGGYFLSITPEDNAIELDRIALINLRDNVSFFDGEISHGILFNSIVGLFKVDHFEPEKDEYVPDRCFFDGQEFDPADLEETIADKFFPAIEELRTEEDKHHYASASRRFNLCPITRSIIRRYGAWLGENSAPVQVPRAAELHSAGACQVFISFKSADLQVARSLYEYLGRGGYRVFCSAESLARLGESDYCAAIDRALDSASCLIVLGTHPAHFDSGWVGYEWRSFLNEYHSGRKPHGRLFTFASGVRAEELPFALRSQQMIQYSPSSPEDSFDNLHRYISAAVRRA
jgi:hypothetical protein